MAASLVSYVSQIRSPFGGEKVYKDECVYSFDTPECETGLYVCMKTFLGFGKKHVERHYRKTGSAVYLHMCRIKREIPKSDEDPPKKKPTRLAIGVEGGFDVDEKKYEFEEHNSIVVLPDWTSVPLTDAAIPPEMQVSAAAILAADSAAKQEEAALLAGTWEGEVRVISKHAETLPQLDNGVRIPPSGWKCERCDKTDNLWLNLTDGSILCGRKFWDGTGGNNHAVEHYEQAKHPLAVKLGTITAAGADVHSYDEDDMVEDPLLAKHLAHFGINITQLEKTDKTMAEMEIDLNQKVGEWDVIQEAGSQLTPIYGPGFTGIRNLGNSCYMNAVMQVFFTVPDVVEKYASVAESYFNNAPLDPTNDFGVQIAKLGQGLLSGEYAKPPPDASVVDSAGPSIKYQEGIRPQMFRSLIGHGHPEFATKRQQDALEYLLHLLNLVERNCHGSTNPTDAFKFQVEERIECTGSGKVKYMTRDDYLLQLPIPTEAAINKEEFAAFEKKKRELEEQKKQIAPQDLVRPHIPLSACIHAFSAPAQVEDFYSSALQAKTIAKKTTRLATFPDYLFIQLKKFTVGEDWVPKKLDVSVGVTDELDLSSLRALGLQPGEEQLPEAVPEPEPEMELDLAVVAQLADMGFAFEGCKKAVYHTNNSGVEQAMNWVMEHMADPDFAEPFRPLQRSSNSDGAAAFVADENALAMIMSMGFTQNQATMALRNTDNNVERAADWIFSHADELDAPMETDQSEPSGASAAAPPLCRDGHGKYVLSAFISHMGTSNLVGHYVCHIKKNGQWVIFNDEKVALSEKTPKDLGYIYLYKRV